MVTAGNSSGVNDGAAVIIANEKAINDNGLNQLQSCCSCKL